MVEGMSINEIPKYRTQPKPCPFCGGKARVWTGESEAHVECAVCGARTKIHSCRDDAVSAWNIREPELRYTYHLDSQTVLNNKRRRRKRNEQTE